MARPGITDQQVLDAVQQLQNKGQAVTTVKVREIIGSGSLTTVGKKLEKLRENNNILEPTDTRDVTITSQEMESEQREMHDKIIGLEAKIEALMDAQDKTSKETDYLKLENHLLKERAEKAENSAKDMLNQNKQLETVLATMYKFKKHEIVKIFITGNYPNRGYYLYNVLVLSYPKTKIDGIKKPVLCDFTYDGKKAIFDEDYLERYDTNDPQPDLSKMAKHHKIVSAPSCFK